VKGASEKQHAHELIDRLPPAHVATAVRFLEFILLDPVSRAIATAPVDDEPTKNVRRSLARRLGSASAGARAFRWRKCSPTSA
jgi:hypothetical protein